MKKYVINKNKHYSSGINFGITLKNEIKFICKFDENCLYKFNDSDKYDINKLFGFSTTWFHHKQSARVGWRCIDGKNIQLLTYSYNKNKWDVNESDLLAIVKPNQEFICTITDKEEYYQYTYQLIDSDEIIEAFDKKTKDWFLFHYYLYPYFGGNKRAPHKMFIYLKTI